MDETKLKLRGEQIHCWLAIDEGKRLLAVNVSRGRSSLDALKFLKRLRKSCEEESIIYIDHGPWYGWACKILGFEHRSMNFGEKIQLRGSSGH